MSITTSIRRSIVLCTSIGSMLLGLAACDSKPPTTVTSDVPAQQAEFVTPRIATQTVPADPCGWLDRVAVEKALGTSLAADPVRVRSPDNTTPSPQGEACLYQVSGATAGADSIAMQVVADEPGIMRSTLSALEVHEPGLADTAKNQSGWDFIAKVPGGPSLRLRGRLGFFVNAPGQEEHAAALIDAVLARTQDLPFTMADKNPAVAPRGNDPCSLITRDEAAAEIGPVVVEPFRSAESSALAYGAGDSCTYYLGNHRAVVLTPMWEGGATMFNMVGAVDNLLQGSGVAPKRAFNEGEWDDMGTGVGDSIQVLKGDRLLNVQYLNAGLTRAQAIALLKHAHSKL